MVPIGKRRAGQASVLGLMFILILLIGSFAAILGATNAIINYTDTTQDMNLFDNDRFNERVEITSAYVDRSRRLVLNMTNSGSSAAQLKTLWIINQTSNQHFSYDLSQYYVNPGDSIQNVTRVTLASGKDYAIRVVTTRGNIISYNLVPAVRARIQIIGEGTVFAAQNMTVAVMITNNDTSKNNIFDLTPTLTWTPSGALTLKEGPTPSSVALLPQGTSATFRYILKATGAATSFRLNASFANAPPGNYALFNSELGSIATTGTVTRAAITDITIYGAVPNPTDGTTSTYAYYSVIWANPSNRTTTVYSIGIISASNPLFGASPGAGLGAGMGIYPSTGWDDQSSSNAAVVFWSSTTGVSVPARSAYNFTVRIDGENQRIFETDILLETVTDAGRKVSFAYATTQDPTYPSMNVYYAPDASHTISYVYSGSTGVSEATATSFTLTLANTGDSSLSSSAKVIIVIPIGWLDVTAASGQAAGYWGTPTITANPDGSFTLTVSSTVATLVGGGTRSFTFTVTTPSVTSDTLYLMPTVVVYPDYTVNPPAIASTITDLVVQVKNT